MIRVNKENIHIEGNAQTIGAELAYLIDTLAENNVGVVMASIVTGMKNHIEDLKDLKEQLDKEEEDE